jgi:hypothetical protein
LKALERAFDALPWKKIMSRNRRRVPLQAGMKLNINELLRGGVMPRPMEDEKAGSLAVRYPTINFEQEIHFVSRKRHFGGRQYYFECPSTGRLCSTLWKPPGATRFACRQAWRGQVAYAIQFADVTDRCHLARSRILKRLGAPDGWDELPPRPKRMRQATYARLESQYDLQEKKLDDALLRRFGMKWSHLIDDMV